MQVVGLNARASGFDADLRPDSPFAAYAELAVHWVVTGPAGELVRVKVTDPEFMNWPPWKTPCSSFPTWRSPTRASSGPTPETTSRL
jgi:Ni,Fe-hydrogenase III large subunit